MTQFPPDYPVEYIEGKVRFFGRDFVVTPDVLIPRLETEGLVRGARKILQIQIDNSKLSGVGEEKIKAQNEETEGDKLSESDESNITMSGANEFLSLSGAFGTFHSGKVGSKETKYGFLTKILGNDGKVEFLHTQEGQIQQNHEKPIIVVDIGCGSGIIGTSIADLADEVIFLDISPAALRVAEQNFRIHFPEKKAQFIVSDLLSNLPDISPNTLFVTNLPYIRDEDWQNMSADTVHEPKLALFGGEKSGFEMYERLFQEMNSLELQNPYSTKLLYEFGFDQRQIAEEVIKKYPHWEYSFFADYAGIERFGEIRY